MTNTINLAEMLAQPDSRDRRVTSFALLSLGVVESLSSGYLGATDGVRLFFHADNCLFVRKHLKDSTADQIMSRGVQLPDLFAVLPIDEAQREFQRELTAVHDLCLALLEESPIAA